MSHSENRRSFLRRSSLLAGAAVMAPSLSGLIACAEPVSPFDENGMAPSLLRGAGNGYGPLEPVAKFPEISLPRGFFAERLSVRGDMMDDGIRVPQALDGMGAFAVSRNIVRLVRNHEIRDSVNGGARPFGPNPYDGNGPSGNSTLEVELGSSGAARLRKQFASLTGTYVNCAGGITPWGSWISSEETVAGTNAGWEKNHGYNFEIPASANGPVDAVPLKAMGRFVHEAIAVDPQTGIVYQTEDRNPGGFYRFIPNVYGNLAAGGKLEMLAVVGEPGYDTRNGQTAGLVLQATWVPIAEADTDTPNISTGFVFNQGFALGGAQFSRLEGCWWGDGGCYFNSTSGGDVGEGQIFKYTPTGPNTGELVLIYESPNAGVLKQPDNVCVSPRGGIVLCEDAPGTNFVRGLSRTGQIFDFVRNNINDAEWAGACFSPQGRTLFVNIQGSTNSQSDTFAATYAIWGPWEAGAL